MVVRLKAIKKIRSGREAKIETIRKN